MLAWVMEYEKYSISSDGKICDLKVSPTFCHVMYKKDSLLIQSNCSRTEYCMCGLS